jgi:hypothetical protein
MSFFNPTVIQALRMAGRGDRTQNAPIKKTHEEGK